ncbi:hypothetical protein SRABI106_02396 [Rahnella aquatilis]|nr:hypothetical protein SRABI106_02396 [Rahnella aquatilis]
MHGTTGVFVNDDNFAVFDDVIDIAGEQDVCAQCCGHVMHQHDVSRGIQGFTFFHNTGFNQQFLDQDQTTFSQVNLT